MRELSCFIPSVLVPMCNTMPVPTMSPARLVLCTLVLTATILRGSYAQLLKNLLRNNLAGPAVNFEAVPYVFDPDAGPKSSVEYQAKNGRLGADAIEKVGLGEDGRAEQRKAQQMYRDSIGALTYKYPGLK